MQFKSTSAVLCCIHLQKPVTPQKTENIIINGRDFHSSLEISTQYGIENNYLVN